MQLLDFTPEIIYMIIDSLPNQRDISALIRTNHCLYDGFHETLYTSTKDKQELLQWTCENGNANLATKMLQLGAKAKMEVRDKPSRSSNAVATEEPSSLLDRDGYQYTWAVRTHGPLNLAIRKSQYEVATAIMNFDPSSITHIDPNDHELPIEAALSTGDKKAIKMIRFRPEFDPRKNGTESRSTLLEFAIYMDVIPGRKKFRENAIKILIQDSRVQFDRHLIHRAIQANLEISCLARLLMRGKQYLKADAEDILITAARSGRADVTRYILKVFDKLHPEKFTGELESKALTHACQVYNREERFTSVNLLLSRKNINLKYRREDDRNQTPLLIVTKHGDLRIIKLLFEKANQNQKPDPNAQDQSGSTPLIIASKARHPTITSYLLSIPGINPDIIDSSNKTALCYASANGANIIVRQLLATNRVNPNHKDNTQTTPITHAIRSSAFAWKWLHSSFNLAPDDPPWTPQELETKSQIHKILHGQISHAVALNSGYQVRRMPHICRKCRARKEERARRKVIEEEQFVDALDVVNQLISRDDVEVDCVDVQGRTPLFWAVGYNQVDVVVSLIETGRVDIHSVSDDGRTPDSLSLEDPSSSVPLIPSDEEFDL
ncbi:hypothetical protein PENSTE_c025G10357 [Penicillium steckii]|uniref:Uncharacterized protein n=1 Tax=Penicillium steckii TaxID=303698 RepID=A0A1V6SPY3_9EURO|nr:hypothetical protein PENSTE_c025G10357 [Penicillium steckii]